jgi:hypothetical protein
VADSQYYRGLVAIAKRLEITPNAVLRLQRDFALPLYRELRSANVAHWQWVISESAIVQWELWRARLARAYVQLVEAFGLTPRTKADPYGRRHYLAVMAKFRELQAAQLKEARSASQVDLGSNSLDPSDQQATPGNSEIDTPG